MKVVANVTVVTGTGDKRAQTRPGGELDLPPAEAKAAIARGIVGAATREAARPSPQSETAPPAPTGETDLPLVDE